MEPLDIAGKTILVTRPAHQVKELIERLKKQGANPIALPLIKIEPLHENRQALPPALEAKLQSLFKQDILFFPSKNAVMQLERLLSEEELNRLKLKTAATVGDKTKSYLDSLGFKTIISPEKEFNSEGLLKSSHFDPEKIQDKKVMLIRGIADLSLIHI